MAEAPAAMKHADNSGRAAAVGALVAACFIAGVTQTSVVPLQADLPALLNADPALTAWTMTANSAGACVFTVISGRLGDLHGRKRVLVALLGILLIGSIVCAAAPDAWFVILGRTLQGIGLGVIPLGISLLHEVVTGKHFASRVALAAAMLAAGAAIGQIFGAGITQLWGWRTMFGLSALAVFLCLLWAARFVPSGPSIRERFDAIGAAGIVIGSTAVLIGISQGIGRNAVVAVALIGAGLLVLAVTNLGMLKRASPLVDVRLAFARPVLLTNTAAALINFAAAGSTIVIPYLLGTPGSDGIGITLTPVMIGTLTMSASVSQALSAPFVAWCDRRVGSRRTLLLGAAITAMVFTVALVTDLTLWTVLALNITFGFGFALVTSSLAPLLMSVVPHGHAAEVNGLNLQIRTFGAAAGMAVTGAVLAHSFAGGYPLHNGFLIAFGVVALAAAIGVAVILAMPKTERPRTGRAGKRAL